MSPGISPTSEIFLSNLQQIENRISTAERQLSSGLRVQVASDDPDQISTILQVRAQIAGVQQTQENLATIGPQVNSAEDAIQQAIQVLDTATTLATEAANGTSSASQRLDEASQVQDILQQLVSLSQTSINGQYIFSGNLSSQPAYSLNAEGNGVTQNITPGAPGQIQDANGVPFSIGLTAQQIFDDQDANGNPTVNNVFAAVTGLLTALNNNSTPDILTALSNLQSASAHLNSESSFYGAVQNNITAANNSAATMLTNLQQQLSNLQDADAVQSSLDLQAALTAQQAAMSGQAEMKPQSLFNYLG